ncbi:MAG: hypothetical protein K2I18_01280 [Paramuribaculum sp.]|nr:hypothetical protein [Paramuribaculum sp.]
MYRHILPSLLVLLCSCGGRNSEIIQSAKSDDFPVTVDVPDTQIELPSIINIEEWTIDDGRLLCRTKDADKVFYTFNLETFATTDSFGNIGQGPGEYVTPRLIYSPEARTIVADLAKDVFITLDDSVQRKITNAVKGRNLNRPVDLKFPVLGFTELTRDDRKWLIANIETGELIDSIMLTHDGIPKDVPVDIKVSAKDNKVVLVSQFVDEIRIAELSEGEKIKLLRLFKGSAAPTAMQPCYVDVTCGKDRFYAVSLKNMSFSENGEMSGNSVIEVYDYDGNPIAKLTPEFIPRKILIDERRNRLICLSVDDDNIHLIPLNGI